MRRILVVEDNDANMYLTSFILKKNDITVIEARSGEEGVRLAVQEKPDIIIMDIQLPGIDGMEAIRQIKALEEVRSIPIVAFTSYAMTGDREKLLQAGCAGYLEKPINPETFMSDITKHFR